MVSVHNEQTVPIIMAGCIVHARNGRISTSGEKSDVPDFLLDEKILAIRTHLRQIQDYLIFAWVFRTFWPKMGVLWGKIGEGVVRYWPLINWFFLFGVFTSVPILVKINQGMRPWECSQTDRYTDRQTPTDFIICPMLCAIAMRQIKTAAHHNAVNVLCGESKQ